MTTWVSIENFDRALNEGLRKTVVDWEDARCGLWQLWVGPVEEEHNSMSGHLRDMRQAEGLVRVLRRVFPVQGRERLDGQDDRKRGWGSLIVCLVILIAWQATFCVNARKVLNFDPGNTFSVGMSLHYIYFPFYYYFGLFPVYSTVDTLNVDSREELEQLIRNRPETLWMEHDTHVRSGDLGKILLFMPEALVRGKASRPSIIRFNIVFFAGSLALLLLAAWYVRRLALGVLLVALIGSHQYQLVEIFNPGRGWGGQGQVFSFPITLAVICLALSLPMIMGQKLPTGFLIISPVIIGCVLGTFRHIRAEGIPIIASVLGAYLMASGLGWRRKAVICGLLLGSFFAVSQGWALYFERKFDQAKVFMQRAGGHVLDSMGDRYHMGFTLIFNGLGDFDKKHGYAWPEAPNRRIADAQAYAYFDSIMSKNPSLQEKWRETVAKSGDNPTWPWMHPEYEAILKGKVFEDIRRDPLWFLGIIARRAWRIITDTTPAGIAVGGHIWRIWRNGLIFIPGLLILIVARRWDLAKLMLFPLPLSAVALLAYSGETETHFNIYLQVTIAIYLWLIWNAVMKRDRVKEKVDRRIGVEVMEPKK
jgi:hypothetical protein